MAQVLGLTKLCSSNKNHPAQLEALLARLLAETGDRAAVWVAINRQVWVRLPSRSSPSGL